jgi:hypothetical protein
MSYTDRPSDEFISLLRQSGDSDLNVAQADLKVSMSLTQIPDTVECQNVASKAITL